MANGKRPDNRRFDQQRQEQKDAILTRIEEVKSFSEIKATEFALPEGFADLIARREDKMKTTQLRKFFAKIKNLENKIRGNNKNDPLSDEFRNEVVLIIPELAYSRGRGLIQPKFYEMTTTIIMSKLKTVDDYRNFTKFMTAIVAYKKKYGD